MRNEVGRVHTLRVTSDYDFRSVDSSWLLLYQFLYPARQPIHPEITTESLQFFSRSVPKKWSKATVLNCVACACASVYGYCLGVEYWQYYDRDPPRAADRTESGGSLFNFNRTSEEVHTPKSIIFWTWKLLIKRESLLSFFTKTL